MQIKKTKIPGLKIVTNKIYKDSRGHFKEDFLSKNFTKNRFVFSCTSKSKKKRSKRTAHAAQKSTRKIHICCKRRNF